MSRVFFMSLLIVVGLFSCKKTTSYKEKTLRLNIEQDLYSLDPRIGNDGSSVTVIDFLFDGLMRMGKGEQAVPAAAQRYEKIKDGYGYRFFLKKRVWSNGDPVTAHHFEAAWKSILDPDFDTPYAYLLFIIKNAKEAKMGLVSKDEVGVFALDDYTLQVDLVHPVPYFLDLITNPIFFPVHHDSLAFGPNWGSSLGKQFISNGAFILKEWDMYERICLEKNPQYEEADEVFFSQVHFSMINNSMAELEMFRAKQLDWIGRPFRILPMPLIQKLKDQVGSLPVPALTWFECNTTKTPLNNIYLRKAIAYAIDRQTIINQILGGDEICATSIEPPTMTPIQSYFPAYSLQEAKKMLRLAKQSPDFPKHLTLIYSQGEIKKQIVQVIQSMLQENLEIPVELVGLEWNSFFERRLQKDFDLCFMSWYANFNDPIFNLDLFKEKDNELNSTGWSNDQYARLLDMSNMTNRRSLRRKIFEQAEMILMDELPVIPIFFDRDHYLKQPELQGVAISSFGTVDFRKAYLKDVK